MYVYIRNTFLFGSEMEPNSFIHEAAKNIYICPVISKWMCHDWPWYWPQVLLVGNVIWYASRKMVWQLHALWSPKCHWRM